MPSSLLLCFQILSLLSWTIDALPVAHSNLDLHSRKNPGFDIPFERKRGLGLRRKRGDVSGETGLGDNSDLLYTVPIKLGSLTTSVHLDTGSSDLWVITDKCTAGTCTTHTANVYPSSSLNSTGADVTMFYGDSTTGTQASGPIGYETASIAGVAIQNQIFAAVNATTNPTVKYGAAGLFGLGFPSGSEVQEAVVVQQSGTIVQTDAFVSSTYASGPLLSRIAMTNELELPMFSISLQRNIIDIGGGDGMLTVGKLPDGIDNSSLTWVPVRLYNPAEGGLRPPTFAPDEVYPFRWEIDIDGVFLDGKKLADSTEPVSGNVNSTRVSALMDTGNSLLRGPTDVVNNILQTVSPSYDPTIQGSLATLPCSTPHTLAFQIGGKMFPVDPRDFIGSQSGSNAATCVADNIVSTDAPGVGALFRWSIGDPFFKSNLVVFHYGNLTHPSVDPPRIGFLSTVPTNADDLLVQAVNSAKANGGNFASTLVYAPTASAATAAQVTVSPVPVSWAAASTAGVTTPAANNPNTAQSATNGAEPSASTGASDKSSSSASSLSIWGARSGVHVLCMLVVASLMLLF